MAQGNKLYNQALKLSRESGFDVTVVFNLLSKSADKENPKAIYALATWYLHGTHLKKDLLKATEMLNIASEKGEASASFDLAVNYEKGIGVAKDKRKSFLLYLKSFLQGDRGAARELCRCYLYGIGVLKDQELADIWLDTFEK